MSMTLKMVAAYLDSKQFHYRVEEERDIIRLGIGGLDNKGNLDIVLSFDDNDRTLGVRSFNYVTFPPAKKPTMYEVCSKMNDEYRWVKFYVDESDNTVTLADDAVVQLDSCGEEVFELIMRMAGIADGAYPNFMKEIWK